MLWVLPLLALSSACGTSDHQYISEAEQWVTERPDTALTLLKEVSNPKSLSDEWKSRYWLTSAQAHSALNQSLTEDSMVLFALDYYQLRQPQDTVMLQRARTLASSYYWWIGNMDEAKRLMKLSLDESRKSGNPKEIIPKLRGMAELAYKEHNLEDLVRYSEEVIALDGCDRGHADLLNRLAVRYFYHKQDSLCLVAFERAIRDIDTAPDSAYIWRVVIRNYADNLIERGQIDRGIALQERILDHYRRTGLYDEMLSEVVLSLSYAWMLKGDVVRARQYMELAPPDTYDDYNYEPDRFCRLGHRMVLDYVTKGYYNLTDMSEYVNGISNRREKLQSVARAKEQAVQQLRDEELKLTISRQQQLIFFLSLTLGLLIIILILSLLAKRRQKLLAEMEQEMQLLNEQLHKLQRREAEPVASVPPTSPSTITLSGTTSDSLTLSVADLLYIEAVGNYVKICHLCHDEVRSDMLRATSRQMEDDLTAYPMIVRCHRAFLVNLGQVEQIVSKSGVTQLIVKHCNETLPVSRSNMQGVKEAIKGVTN